MTMIYRRLGRAGVKVSLFSFGTWLTFAEQADRSDAVQLLGTARHAGINLFDTAEAYGGGAAERLLGATIERLGWDRATYLLSTKLYWGVRGTVNMQRTLNRKYLLQGIDECLERLRTRFVDLLYCHRPDPDTEVEEVVWAMSDIIAAGKAHYWGTSEWPPERIVEAIEIAERHHLRRPAMEQPEYNLLKRERLETLYAPLARNHGLGLCAWSPLASGLLTGKYVEGGAAAGTRAALAGHEWLARQLLDPEANRTVARVARAARSIGCSPAQLSLAWCARNPDRSSVILGARTPDQLVHNLEALRVLPHLTPAVMAELDAAGRA